MELCSLHVASGSLVLPCSSSTVASLNDRQFPVHTVCRPLESLGRPCSSPDFRWPFAAVSDRSGRPSTRKSGVCSAAAASLKSGEVDMEAFEDAARLVKGILEEMEGHLKELGPVGELEELSVILAAATAVDKRVDRLDFVFMLALDTMLMRAEREKNRQAVALLKIIKSEVLAALAKQFPPHVQVVEMLTRVPLRAVRKDILCMAEAGGGAYGSDPNELQVPAARIKDIIKQADDLIFDLEERPQLPDRKLLARLVLIREEARGLLGGGLWDERSNTRPLSSLPQAEVAFLGVLAGMQPGPVMRDRLEDVLSGRLEGKDKGRTIDIEPEEEDDERLMKMDSGNNELVEKDYKLRMKAAKRMGWGGAKRRKGSAEQVPEVMKETLPVRPGMLLDTLREVLGGAYGPSRASAGDGGMVFQLQWVQKESLFILEALAGWKDIKGSAASS